MNEILQVVIVLSVIALIVFTILKQVCASSNQKSWSYVCPFLHHFQQPYVT